MLKKRRRKNSNLPCVLILAGLVLVMAVVLIFIEKPQAAIETGQTAAVQLEHALADGQPALAFYHSNNCKSCIEMIYTVQEVYPEFSSSVALVDVNVYAPENRPLLQKEQIRYIPTLVLYDRNGSSEITVGIVVAEALRQKPETIQGFQ